MNFSSFNQSVSSEDVKKYRQSPGYISTIETHGGIFVSSLSIAIFGSIVLTMVLSNFFTGYFRTLLIPVLCITLGVLAYISLYRHYNEKNDKQAVRLLWFAKANGFKYGMPVKNIQSRGVIFNVHEHRKTFDRVLFERSGREWEVGNHRYTVSKSRNSYSKTCGFVTVSLNNHIPHILLDAKANDGSLLDAVNGRLPVVPKKNQIVSLEGDFNRYFTLYVPKGYETDARYILTPDLMASLVDKVSIYDLEIVEGKLYIYMPQLDLSSEETWNKLFYFIDNVGQHIIRRTKRYENNNTHSKMLILHSD